MMGKKYPNVVPFKAIPRSGGPGVWYDIAVCHHPDGTIETWCKGVDPNEPAARISAALALRQAADHYLHLPIDEFVDPSEVA